LKELGKVGICLCHDIGYLNEHAALFQLELVSFLWFLSVSEMAITDKVPWYIVDHDAAIEGVEFEEAILPPFLLSPQIVCEQASVLNHRCCVLVQ